LGADTSFWQFNAGFDAAWELDVWGKYRRAVEAGVANLETSIASYDDVLVSLTAEVARTYVLMRTFEERLEIARQNVKIQERSLQIAQIRFKAGAVTELDVSQAKSLLKDTQASIPRFEASTRQVKNALAILLGKLPGEIDSMISRPDIRLAEYQIATQSPLIGVSKAELFPAFQLFGSIGLAASTSKNTEAGGASGSSFSDLFSSNSLEFLGGPAVTWNLFNYGRIKNRTRAEDALMLQYREGLIDFQRVLDSQRFLTAEQDLWTTTRGDVILNLVSLYKALGGGWQIRAGQDFVSKDNIEEMENRTDWGDLIQPKALETPATAEERNKWRSPDW
jgi:outer membrane protein TolC